MMYEGGSGKLHFLKNDAMLNRILLLFFLLLGTIFCFGQSKNSPKNSMGASLYRQYCMSCHQEDGGGVPRMTPPLTGTTYVTGDKKRLITILLNGLNEPIVVQDEEYYNPMASFSFLSDQQIAAVLTYIRTQFGKKSTPILAQEVSVVRKQSTTKK